MLNLFLDIYHSFQYLFQVLSTTKPQEILIVFKSSCRINRDLQCAQIYRIETLGIKKKSDIFFVGTDINL